MIPAARNECPDPALTSRHASADWLAKATPALAAPVIVRRWDDPEWEQVWRLYIAIFRDDSQRRQHLHDVATISFLPVADQFPSHCNLIRLKWAGYQGNEHCDAEEEIIDWAAEGIRESEDDTLIYRIVCVLMGWERSPDSQLLSALQSLCESSPSADVRKAAMTALKPKPAPETHASPTTAAQDPASPSSPKRTQKIIIPQFSPNFGAKNPKPASDTDEHEAK
jgi:hypothetical protein